MKRSLVSFILCTIIGGALVLAAPSFLNAFNQVWNSGLSNFGMAFSKAFMHYLTVGNVVIALITAMLMQPVFTFIHWVAKLPEGRGRRA